MFSHADKENVVDLTTPVCDSDDYADKIKAYRKKHRMTQAELAQMIGVKQFTLRSWEQKQVKPPYHIWRLYKDIFEDVN